MEQPLKQPCYCDVTLCGQKKRRHRGHIIIHLLEIHVYHRQLMVNQILQSALIRFHIFSIIFDPQHIRTAIMNEWCSSVMLPWNSCSCIPTSQVIWGLLLS